MPVTLNGRTWTLDDFSPYGFATNFMPFFQDLKTELAMFTGTNLRDQAAASAASAATSAQQAAASAGAAGSGPATGLAYAPAVKNLVTANDVVAVHVYDTRRDSDGGAWTKGCRGTSWYNEPLNTSTRGATRRFPTVALIVARAASLTIYDAHDLDASGVPRMWMVFNSGATIIGGGTILDVFATQGRVYLACSNLAEEIGFPGDCVNFWNSAAMARRVATIGQRSTTNFSSGAIGSQAIVSSDCRAVHACVLPGAPLDSAGLLIPTVAVATTGGVSVIHPWGAVYDVTDASGHERVYFIAPDRLMTVFRSNLTLTEVGPIPYADVAANVWRNGFYSGPSVAGLLRFPVDGQVISLAPTAQGSTKGLRFLAENRAHPASGMVAYATTEWATGWQPGDIRGAYLCDTATGSITGSGELVSNGDFASGTTGWTVGTGWSIGTGVAAKAAGTGAHLQTSVTIVPGQTYLVTYTITNRTNGAIMPCLLQPFGLQTNGEAVNGNGTFMSQIQASPTQTLLSFYADGNFNGTIDNISLKPALPDRSYKSRGLIVNGALSRTALPCGLAAVSGFSASNFLEQPYNPDLDFETGDWAVICWLNVPAGGAFYAERAYWSGAYSGARINISTPGSDLLRMTVSDGTTAVSVTSTSTVTNGWQQVVFACRSDVLEMWVDGVAQATASLSALGGLSNANAILRVGCAQNGQVSSAAAAVCGVRLSATAPTPTQIRKMYEDERALIIGGLAATLGGTSNNVTALASNPDTGLLLVGTGDGVSEFDGLARTGYRTLSNSSGAIASNNIKALAVAGDFTLIGTAANAGFVADALIARDGLSSAGAAASGPSGLTANDLRCTGTSTDATPIILSPRLFVGEREVVLVRCDLIARQQGAVAGQSGIFALSARFTRDADGTLTLATEADSQGGVRFDTGTPGAEAFVDKTAGALAAALVVADGVVGVQVTGLAATRIDWTGTVTWTRIAGDLTYPA